MQPGCHFIDSGKVITTAGVSAGVDGSPHLVARTFRHFASDRTAEDMEYKWAPESYLSARYSQLNGRKEGSPMATIWSAIQEALSDRASGNSLSVGSMAIRALFVFIVWLVMIRLADRRMLGQYSAYDTVLAVMIGAILGRPVNGGAKLWGSLIAVAALVALHWLLAFLTFRSRALGLLVKGRPRILVAQGKVDHKQMRRSLITESDLTEMLRLRGRLDSAIETKLATLERNGQISAVPLR